MKAAPSLLLLLLLTTLTCWVTSSAAETPTIGEVTDDTGLHAEKRDQATCRRSAVCGMVQTNAWGVSSQPLCRCPGRLECPLRWDSEDGHSVTHGSNQYKFCELAPPLPPCAAGQLAMTDELVLHDDPVRPTAHHQLLHCRCPAGGQLRQTGSQWRPLQHGQLILTERSCTQMPQCKPGQHCKFITRTPGTILVQVNCACGGQLTCPSDTTRAVDTQPMGRGFIRSVYCR